MQQTRSDAPHGDCNGDCVVGILRTDDELEAHNMLVDALVGFQETGDVHELALAFELVASKTEEPSTSDGMPMAGEFRIFVAQHNWPDPAGLEALSSAIDTLVRAVTFRTREADRLLRGGAVRPAVA